VRFRDHASGSTSALTMSFHFALRFADAMAAARRSGV
jgi:hypothetical protein